MVSVYIKRSDSYYITNGSATYMLVQLEKQSCILKFEVPTSCEDVEVGFVGFNTMWT
jgi:hypothetical protein